MRCRQELYFSFIGALVVCAAMFMMASSLVFIDITDFRRQVEQLLRVDFSTIAVSTDALTQEQGEALAEQTVMGDSESLFVREPDSPQVPEVSIRDYFADSASIHDIPVQPPLGLISKNEETVLGASALFGQSPTFSSANLRRSVKKDDIVSRHNDTVMRRVLERVELKDKFAVEIDITQLSLVPEVVGVEVFQPQVVAPLVEVDSTHDVQETVEYRPDSGYQSLDNEIVARYSREQFAGKNYFNVDFFLRRDSDLPILNKDVLFLVDVSQSMGLERIRAVRRAINNYLSAMREGDRWNICIFSENVYSLNGDYSFFDVSEFSSGKVKRFIKRPGGESMTDLFAAAGLVLRRIPKENRPCNIFLISDGKANYSIVDVRRIVKGFSRERRDNFSIFTFMVGQDKGEDLLRLLAYRSRGFFAKAKDGQGLAKALADFFIKYDQPVLSNCVANYTNLNKDQVYPQVLPNLYRNVPISFTGYAQDASSFVLRVIGLGLNRRPQEFYFRPQGHKLVTSIRIYRQWARGRAYDMVQSIIDAQTKHDFLKQLLLFKDFVSRYRLYEFSNMAQLLEKSARQWSN